MLLECNPEVSRKMLQVTNADGLKASDVAKNSNNTKAMFLLQAYES
jgi:hypothetical protein